MDTNSQAIDLARTLDFNRLPPTPVIRQTNNREFAHTDSDSGLGNNGTRRSENAHPNGGYIPPTDWSYDETVCST